VNPELEPSRLKINDTMLIPDTILVNRTPLSRDFVKEHTRVAPKAKKPQETQIKKSEATFEGNGGRKLE
jgi:hypothetical protein